MDELEFDQAISPSASIAPDNWKSYYDDIDYVSEETGNPSTFNWNPNASDSSSVIDSSSGSSDTTTEDTPSATESWIDGGGLGAGQSSTSLDNFLKSVISQNNGDPTVVDSMPQEVKQSLYDSIYKTQGQTGQTPTNQTDWGKKISELLKGADNKTVAALVQGGFGMLSGASQAKMLEKNWENQRKMRDEEWARKDQHSYAATVKPVTFSNSNTGLLGSKV